MPNALLTMLTLAKVRREIGRLCQLYRPGTHFPVVPNRPNLGRMVAEQPKGGCFVSPHLSNAMHLIPIVAHRPSPSCMHNPWRLQLFRARSKNMLNLLLARGDRCMSCDFS